MTTSQRMMYTGAAPCFCASNSNNSRTQTPNRLIRAAQAYAVFCAPRAPNSTGKPDGARSRSTPKYFLKAAA